MSDNPTPEIAPESGAPEGEKQTFTQDEVNKLIGQTRAEERRKANEKYADHDDLKVRAGEAKTLEERLAAVETENQRIRMESLRLRIAAKHGISTEPGKDGDPSDADLFLTGTDEASMTKQAQRLSAQVADRKKNANVVPTEGKATPPPAEDEARAFARDLFGRATTD